MAPIPKRVGKKAAWRKRQTQEAARNVYGMNPQRALLIIDSAEIVGNEREQLFLDPNFERQTLIKLTGISKNRIGAAFAQGSGHERLTSLVREMRLDYAVRLMNEHPELSVDQVRVASGFTSADTFTRNFRTKYGMTPTAYCASKS